MLKVVRLMLGALIAFIDKLTRGRKMKRPEPAQAEVEKRLEKLALYQFTLCPFCIKVRRKMHQLNLPIETRDAKNDPRHRQDLLEQGGRIKVPCLRIETEAGSQWMYESDDINRYLNKEFGGL